MKREIEIQLTPRELAREFAELSAERQVDFFVELEHVFRAWSSYRRDRQTQDIGAELRAAGDYAQQIIRKLAAETFRVPEEELHRALIAWGERMKGQEA